MIHIHIRTYEYHSITIILSLVSRFSPLVSLVSLSLVFGF